MTYYRVYATFAGETFVRADSQEAAEAQIARQYGPGDFNLTLQSVEVVASAEDIWEAFA